MLKTEGIFDIKFRHYKTGEIQFARGTLDPGLTGNRIIDQHPDSTVVVFWDIDQKQWRSIYKESIIYD